MRIGSEHERRMWSMVCIGLLGLLLSACEPQGVSTGSLPPSVSAAASSSALPASEPTHSSQLRYSLGIVGYNYTEVGIDDFLVNGTGAFNLGVSNEDSGGGKTVCCFGWAPGMKLPMPIRIEWTRGGDRWCRKTVMLNDPGPLEPTTFEVHFYPDRHIEVAITDNYSPPRLLLPAVGAAYRIGKDVRAEDAEAVKMDAAHAECRQGRFPIGG